METLEDDSQTPVKSDNGALYRRHECVTSCGIHVELRLSLSYLTLRVLSQSQSYVSSIMGASEQQSAFRVMELRA